MRAFLAAVWAFLVSHRTLLFKLLAGASGLTMMSQGGMMASGEAATDPTNVGIVGGGILGFFGGIYAWLKTRPIGKTLLEKSLDRVRLFVRTQGERYPELMIVIREFVLEILPQLFADDDAAAAQVDLHVAGLARLAADVKYGIPPEGLMQAVESAAAARGDA